MQRHTMISPKQFLIGLTISCFVFQPSCKPRGPDPATAKCDEALRTIREMELFAKTHQGTPGSRSTQALQGVEIALTADLGFESMTNPAEGEDDWCYPDNTDDKLTRFLRALKENGIPPTLDFLVGSHTSPSIAELWLKSGNMAGNLTYSRANVSKNSGADFVGDISKDDQLLSGLWAKYPPAKKYFRYPGLRTSEDPEARNAVDGYLEKAGYTIVPVTIDSRDDKFAQVYCAALARGDGKCAASVLDNFYDLLKDSIARARAAGLHIAGRDIKQIMAVETNRFTCENIEEVLARLKAAGVHFIKVDDALQDSFYGGSGSESTARARSILTAVRDQQLGNTEGN
jgi:hypothetical protein